MFEKEKKERLSQLYLPDKSPKGNVDEAIKPLLDAINKNPNYYTMSSCSGRISVSKVKDAGKGLDWIFVSHDLVSFDDLKKSLLDLPKDGVIYFRYEGIILHICAKDLSFAEELVIAGQNNGCKYSSIISTKKRFIVEYVDMIRLDVPIAKEGNLLVDDSYLHLLLDEANKKLKQSHLLISRLKKYFE